jgi:F0F1-type ATP synthase membrane subunit b/b'
VRSIVILEWMIVAILVVLFVTQIIVPVIQGKPLFPLLRKRGREIENQIAAAREDIELADKQGELSNLKRAKKAATTKEKS